MSDAMLPAICTEMRVIERDGVPVVNSRDVAEAFDKDHANVLRDIRELEMPSNLKASWFMPSTYRDAYGREIIAADLSRQGVSILCFGWTGPKALTFKVRYIQAFDAMEEALRIARDGLALGYNDPARLYAVLVELAQKDAVALELLGKLDGKLDRIGDTVGEVRNLFNSRRRLISPRTKNEILYVMMRIGRRCPCCSMVEVVLPNGDKAPTAQFDHFFQNSWANIEHVWLICDQCHSNLTRGLTARADVQSEFKTYQNRRAQISRRQRASKTIEETVLL